MPPEDPFEKFKPGKMAEVTLADGSVVSGELRSISWLASEGEVACDFSIAHDNLVYFARWTELDVSGVPPKVTEIAVVEAMGAAAEDMAYADAGFNAFVVVDHPDADLSQIAADLSALKAKEPAAEAQTTHVALTPPPKGHGQNSIYEMMKDQILHPEAYEFAKQPPKPLEQHLKDLMYESGKALQQASEAELATVKGQALGMSVPLYSPISLKPTAPSPVIKVLHIKLEVYE